MNKKKPSANITLDSFDLAVLSILQQNNLVPQREIATAVNLSAAAVNRRIKRMQDSGVIRQNLAVIDPAKMGQLITIIAEVEFEDERIDLVDEAKRRFTAAAEVQQCYYVTGETDFILIITVPSMAYYETLTRRLFFDDSNIKRFRTFVAMDSVKVGLSVPLPI